MNDAIAFSKSNPNTFRDAALFMSKYHDYFKFQESENILEIGCANGRITKEILYPQVRKHLNSLLAIDLSQEAVKAANELYGAENLRFEEMNVEEPKVVEQYRENFHHIFAFSVFHMFQFPQRSSQHIFSMLKPGGQFFSSSLLQLHPYMQVLKEQRADKTAPWAKYFQSYPSNCKEYKVGDVEAFLKTAGFIIEMAEVHHRNATYNNFEDLYSEVIMISSRTCLILAFLDTLLGVNNFFRYIPEDLHKGYARDFRERLSKNVYRSEDGSWYYPRSILTVIAVKP